MAVMPRPLLVCLGRGQPHLQAMQIEPLGLERVGCAFDVGNGAAGGHPADVTGLYHLIGAKAVLVQEFAFKQVGEGGQANMRMLADIHAAARGIAGLEHMVEKHEGPDATAFPRGQRAQDGLAFDIFGARADHSHGGHGASLSERVCRA